MKIKRIEKSLSNLHKAIDKFNKLYEDKIKVCMFLDYSMYDKGFLRIYFHNLEKHSCQEIVFPGDNIPSYTIKDYEGLLNYIFEDIKKVNRWD